MKKFDYAIVKNPKIFQENRLPAHSDHVCMPNWFEGENNSYRMNLDGLWKFSYAKNMDLAVAGFEEADYSCKGWDEIRVPEYIQMEGYDVTHYTNTTYPWETIEFILPGEIPTEFNPVASYVKYFTLPLNMRGERVCISFQGVESGFAVWLNGHYVGYSENSFNPAEFELTPYLKEGENKLAVRVWKWTSSSWCENQDFFQFSGIFRSVYLYMVPKTHLWDVQIVPELSEDFSEAMLTIITTSCGKGEVEIRLLDDAMTPVLEGTMALEDGEEGSDVIQSGIAGMVYEPKLWSAEEPNLYILQLEVRDEYGDLTEVTSQYVGFRRFEMKDGIMTLNGKRIVFKGVNRHEFNADRGRVPNREDVEKDIVTMKQNNINAVRTSHYPNDSNIYELCDEYGLYMIAENNLESYGMLDAYQRGMITQDMVVPGDNEEWLPMMLDRVNSCYQRDKNHPSILIWSVGNEAYGGKVIYEMSQKFRELDTQRLVHYEGIFHDRRYNDTSDVESQMYTSVKNIEKFLAEHSEKPFICCEYSLVGGNSCDAMYKYTDLSDREVRYQGGFIADYNFSGNGICYRDSFKPSPKIQEVKYNYQNISVEFDEKTFTVWNKNLFVNTDVYEASVTLQKDGQNIAKVALPISVDPFEQRCFDIPQQLLDIMDNIKIASVVHGGEIPEFAITVSFVLPADNVWGKRGHEVAFGQYVYKKEVVPYTCEEKLEVVKGWNNIVVKGHDFKALFSSLNAGLVSYVYGGVEMLKSIPLPNFWRVPMDNDTGSLMQQRYAQWKIASMYVTMKNQHRVQDTSPVIEELEDSIKLTYTFYMPTNPASSCQVFYHVFGDGTIETTMEYEAVEGLCDMPEFGMLFKLDTAFNHLSWYGLGPEETYVDRMNGGKLGIYENKVADNLAKYLHPQECGNKCGVRYAEITNDKGSGMRFFGDELSFSALPYTPHELENAVHNYELPDVHYTVVRVAKQQMGIAGDDSWRAKVNPEYLLDVSKKKVFTFCFRGV